MCARIGIVAGVYPAEAPRSIARGRTFEVPLHPPFQGREAGVCPRAEAVENDGIVSRAVVTAADGAVRAKMQCRCRSWPARTHSRQASWRDNYARRTGTTPQASRVVAHHQIREKPGTVAGFHPGILPTGAAAPSIRWEVVCAGRRRWWRPSPMDWAPGEV